MSEKTKAKLIIVAAVIIWLIGFWVIPPISFAIGVVIASTAIFGAIVWAIIILF